MVEKIMVYTTIPLQLAGSLILLKIIFNVNKQIGEQLPTIIQVDNVDNIKIDELVTPQKFKSYIADICTKIIAGIYLILGYFLAVLYSNKMPHGFLNAIIMILVTSVLCLFAYLITKIIVFLNRKNTSKKIPDNLIPVGTPLLSNDYIK